MTRINSAIAPAILCDQHLLAEYRELPRVSTYAHKYAPHPRPQRSPIPKEFCLGSGHVLFFIDKGGFLYQRYDSIVQELLSRGFELSFTEYRLHPTGFNKNHSPTEAERLLLEERISLRMPKKPRYRKQPIHR